MLDSADICCDFERGKKRRRMGILGSLGEGLWGGQLAVGLPRLSMDMEWGISLLLVAGLLVALLELPMADKTMIELELLAWLLL